MESKTIYIGKKPKYDAGILVRMDKELKKEVQKIALEKDKTFSEIAREVLGEYVLKNRPKKRTIKSKKSV